MNITIISGAETGGAGNSAKNLQKGFLNMGVQADFLSEQDIIEGETNVFSKFRRWWLVRKYIRKNYSYLKDAPSGYDHFSFARTGYQNVQEHPLVKKADIINIHWISYLVDYKTFFRKIDKPIIFTLHDTNLFTGGCHYTFACENYMNACESCMQLPARVKDFAAKDNLQLKTDSLKALDPSKVMIVSPSKWLKGLSEKSALFKHYPHFHIPYGIDTAVFKKRDKMESRIEANLPPNKFIVLFVATSLTEYRKGFDVIVKLKSYFNNREDVLFVAIGQNDMNGEGIYSTGYIADKKQMAAIYNAADVFVIPSREDNLPNTLLESLCCGTPVIGFKTGGIPEVIEHNANGFLIENENIAMIVTNIAQMINNKDIFDNDNIANTACEKYSLERQAHAYQELINEWSCADNNLIT